MNLTAEPLNLLRTRTSSKWARYDTDVLPLPVAEMDYPLAPEITAALHAAIDRGDTGYNPGSTSVARAFAGFAERHWGWSIDQANIKVTGDVAMGIVELLRMVTKPGDPVVICPPIYPPFFILTTEAGCATAEVPLLGSIADGWALDFAGIEAAFAAGARAILLCSPHNPVGRVWTRAELAELAELAERYDAWIIADEIHAPITFSDAEFVPILSVSDAAREHAFSVTSASKSFNLAGLKCAHMVAGSARGKAVLDALPLEVEWRAGLFGAIANTVAFTECDEWLAAALAAIDTNRRVLGELLASQLPQAHYRQPQASYLAWVNLSDCGFEENPAARALAEAKVAFGIGPDFGAAGAHHIRVNLACSPEMLTEAITRFAALPR